MITKEHTLKMKFAAHEYIKDLSDVGSWADCADNLYMIKEIYDNAKLVKIKKSTGTYSQIHTDGAYKWFQYEVELDLIMFFDEEPIIAEEWIGFLND